MKCLQVFSREIADYQRQERERKEKGIKDDDDSMDEDEPVKDLENKENLQDGMLILCYSDFFIFMFLKVFARRSEVSRKSGEVIKIYIFELALLFMLTVPLIMVIF